MVKRFNGTCSKYGIKVNGWIDYIDSSTQEGDEYSKSGMRCDYNDVQKKCTRNDCPFWKVAQKVIKI